MRIDNRGHQRTGSVYLVVIVCSCFWFLSEAQEAPTAAATHQPSTTAVVTDAALSAVKYPGGVPGELMKPNPLALFDCSIIENPATRQECQQAADKCYVSSPPFWGEDTTTPDAWGSPYVNGNPSPNLQHSNGAFDCTNVALNARFQLKNGCWNRDTGGRAHCFICADIHTPNDLHKQWDRCQMENIVIESSTIPPEDSSSSPIIPVEEVTTEVELVPTILPFNEHSSEFDAPPRIYPGGVPPRMKPNPLAVYQCRNIIDSRWVKICDDARLPCYENFKPLWGTEEYDSWKSPYINGTYNSNNVVYNGAFDCTNMAVNAQFPVSACYDANGLPLDCFVCATQHSKIPVYNCRDDPTTSSTTSSTTSPSSSSSSPSTASSTTKPDSSSSASTTKAPTTTRSAATTTTTTTINASAAGGTAAIIAAGGASAAVAGATCCGSKGKGVGKPQIPVNDNVGMAMPTDTIANVVGCADDVTEMVAPTTAIAHTQEGEVKISISLFSKKPETDDEEDEAVVSKTTTTAASMNEVTVSTVTTLPQNDE